MGLKAQDVKPGDVVSVELTASILGKYLRLEEERYREMRMADWATEDTLAEWVAW